MPYATCEGQIWYAIQLFCIEILGPKSSFCLRLQKYFCRVMKSDIKRTQFFGSLSFAFFPGTRGMTWALATALLTKLRRASPAVAMVIVLETLSALAAKPVRTSSNIEQRIFPYFL